jgi:hypothetical protein
VSADQTSDEELARVMLALLAERDSGKTIDPAEVARAVAGSSPEAWGPMMQPVRRTAVKLAREGQLVIYRKGRPVDPADFKGVYRLGPPPHD